MLTRSCSRLLTTALALLVASALAQAPTRSSTASTQLATLGAPVPITAAEDHQRMMDLLHITELRPGVKQNGTGPNPVNWDESKANPWPTLPDPLLLTNGKRVTSAKVWWNQRRPELVEIFDREILGRAPAFTPAVHWEVTSTTPGSEAGIATVTKHLIGHVDNSADPAIPVNIEAQLILPAAATGPVPVVVEITFDPAPSEPPAPPRPPATNAPPKPPDPTPSARQQTLAKGWGYALYYPRTVQADNGAGLTRGIIGLCNHGQPRGLEDWGALRAWAWGAARLLDYFETDKAVDARHVAIAGHSRFGKAALVTMAYDQRFAAAYVNSSGAGGADLARRRFGEQLENIAGSGEFHWMGGNYLKYAELSPKQVTPNDMPVDMHELIGLCAPRPVFIGGGTLKGGDGWADVDGTFIAEVAADPVYKLLGKKGVSDANGLVTTLPPVAIPLIAGDLAFLQHPGGHNYLPNFATFLDWSIRYLAPATIGRVPHS